MKKIISYIITAMMVFTIMPYTAFSEAVYAETDNLTTSYKWVNPIYENVELDQTSSTESDGGISTFSLTEPEYLSSTEEAGAALREQMINRVSDAVVYYQMPATQEFTQELIGAICDEIYGHAVAHTGNPKEGDSLAFVAGGYEAGISASMSDNNYLITFNFQMTYYTDSDQEAALDEAVAALKTQLALDGKTDYEKVKAIYDYMTANITYDYDGLAAGTDKTIYTAYAALVNKTSVCQGYATLLYRMLLEYDIDNRIVAGVSNGENHSWNIVKLGDVYYNLDATWDSTWDEDKTTHTYFLKSADNFSEHVRDAEYTADAFAVAYPMSAGDYVPCVEHKEEEIPAVAATCTETGLTAGVKCSNCGEVLTVQEEVAAIGHSFEWIIDTPATEDSEGIKHEECATCATVRSENTVIEKLAHTHIIIKTEAVAATCTETGNIEYYVCSKCGNIYSDEAGNYLITEEETIIPTIDHTFSEDWYADEESHWHQCHCGEKNDIENHDLQWIENDGLMDEICQGCGYAKSENCLYEGITIGQPEEMTLQFYSDADVEVESGDTSVLNSRITGSSLIISNGAAIYCRTVKLTPVKVGKAKFTVKLDGEIVKEYCFDVKPAEITEISHIGYKSVFEYTSLFDEDISFDNIDGVKVTVLSKTQRTNTSTINGVTVTEISYIYKIQAEYDQPGEILYSIFGGQSGEIYRVTADVTDHEWEDEYTIDVEPTCVAEGSKSIHCTSCDVRKDETVIPMTGEHQYSEWILEKETSCAEAGSKYKVCANCPERVIDEIEKLEHDFAWVIDKEATEEESGLKHEVCQVCGEISSENTVIDKLTHTHVMTKTEATAATCTEAGNVDYYTCQACNNIYLDDAGQLPIEEYETVIVATGHTFGEWEVDKEATCAEAGSKHRDCQGCTEKETAEIEKPEHIFNWVIDKPATSEEAGIKHEACDACGVTRNENTVIDKLTHIHVMVKIGAVMKTCTEDGNIEYYTCSLCGNIYLDDAGQSLIEKEDTVIKAGHDYNDWKIMNKSTCARKGYEFSSCEDCGVAEIRELPLDDHKFTHTTKQPTCTEEGAEIETCGVCKMQISESVPATGHKAVYIEKAATCTEAGATGGSECSVCGEELKAAEVIPAKGHSYGEWIVDKTASCTEAGSQHRNCTVCGDVETAEIEMIQHVEEAMPEVEATCTVTGLTEGSRCAVCGAVLAEQIEVAAKGHSYGEWVVEKEATCTVAGSQYKVCACGDRVTEAIPVIAHHWESKYTVDKTSTTKRSGSKSYHCADCNVVNKDSVVKISRIKKTTVPTLVYNGKNRAPIVSIIDYNGKKLKKGTDYTVTYKNAKGTKVVKPKLVGTYTVVVTFKGSYSGTSKVKFNIKPKAAPIKSLKAGDNRFTVKWTKRIDQVTGYQIRYSTSSKFTKSTTKTTLVKSYKTTSTTIKKLKNKKKYYVQVRSYKTVNGIKYYSNWSAKKTIRTK